MTIQTFQTNRTTDEPKAHSSTSIGSSKNPVKNNDQNISEIISSTQADFVQNDEPINFSLKNTFPAKSLLTENANRSNSNKSLANSLSNLNLSISEIEPVTDQSGSLSKTRLIADTYPEDISLLNKSLISSKNNALTLKNNSSKRESHRRHHSHGQFLKNNSLNGELPVNKSVKYIINIP
jgi:hypothetical protein